MSSVTVVTPAYNAEKHIMSAISSVSSQNMADIEMLIVDDNSTDNTRSILIEAKKKYPFIKIFTNNKNMGAAFCRNLAIRKSRGKYIAFLDADDMWLSGKLEKQVLYMQANQVSFSYTSYYTINSSGEKTGGIIKANKNYDYQRLLYNCPIGCLTVIYEKRKFNITYMPNIRRGQDYGFWLKLLRQNPSIGYLEEPLAMYRDTPDSISSSKIRKIINMYDLYKNHLKINSFNSCIYIGSHIIHSLIKKHTFKIHK